MIQFNYIREIQSMSKSWKILVSDFMLALRCSGVIKKTCYQKRFSNLILSQHSKFDHELTKFVYQVAELTATQRSEQLFWYKLILIFLLYFSLHLRLLLRIKYEIMYWIALYSYILNDLHILIPIFFMLKLASSTPQSEFYVPVWCLGQWYLNDTYATRVQHSEVMSDLWTKNFAYRSYIGLQKVLTLMYQIPCILKIIGKGVFVIREYYAIRT